MNNITELDAFYIRGDRTIETYLLTDPAGNKKVVYLFNREGLYFKVFLNLGGLYDYFISNSASGFDIEFDNEEELDNFLLNIDLNKVTS